MSTKNSKVVEIRPNIFYSIPKREKGIQLLLRRLKQLWTILFSKYFSSHRNFEKDINERYAQEKEINYYQAISYSGLYKEEKYALEEALKVLPSNPTALVIGSGTGREAFALESYGFNVTGIDSCRQMVEKSRELAKSQNSSCLFKQSLNKKIQFDLIYTTFSLTNHIPYKSMRINFLTDLKKYMNADSILLFGGYFRSIKVLDRFWISHHLLKLRWFLKRKIEKGTTVISHLGHHNDESRPILFHFYQNKKEMLEELTSAGFKAKVIDTPPEEFNGGLDNFWIAQISKIE